VEDKVEKVVEQKKETTTAKPKTKKTTTKPKFVWNSKPQKKMLI